MGYLPWIIHFSALRFQPGSSSGHLFSMLMQNPQPRINKKTSIYGDKSHESEPSHSKLQSRLSHTRTEDLARVIPTFIRLKSATKPMPLSSLARTHEKIATSFSRPWKVFESTQLHLFKLQNIKCIDKNSFMDDGHHMRPSTVAKLYIAPSKVHTL